MAPNLDLDTFMARCCSHSDGVAVVSLLAKCVIKCAFYYQTISRHGAWHGEARRGPQGAARAQGFTLEPNRTGPGQAVAGWFDQSSLAAVR